jgi:predicted nicotinamide N-methyase
MAEDGPQTKQTRKQHIVTIREKDIFLQEDWASGIGGGLWSTGLALGKYFDTPHAQNELESNGIRTVLELGSGNGFLSMCLLAASPSLERVVVTDTRDHLTLMQSTIDSNTDVISSTEGSTRAIVQVAEYIWGTGPIKVGDDDVTCSPESTFDLIIGSDLAYRDSLHDPLIDAFSDCSHSRTVIILGVTMNDTKPIFFSKLITRGFQYEKLAAHCVDPSFRGTNFGIFIIQRKQR